MNYFATYNRELGFKISIDGFHNTPHPIPYGCIVSLNPPGSLYTSATPGEYRDVRIHIINIKETFVFELPFNYRSMWQVH